MNVRIKYKKLKRAYFELLVELGHAQLDAEIAKRKLARLEEALRR